MKNIAIIAKKNEKFQNFAASAETPGKTKITVLDIDDFGFLIHNQQASIIDTASGQDLKIFDEINVLYCPVKNLSYLHEAVALYAKKYKIKMRDDAYWYKIGKLYAMWQFWADGIAIPDTAYGPTDFLVECFEKFGSPCVLKDIFGLKGRNNYLIKTAEEIREIVANNPEIHFILQKFIPNDGDFRVLTFDYSPEMVILFRTRGYDRGRNVVTNKREEIPLKNVDKKILDIASRAAKSLDIKFAGVDVILNSETGECAILEANRCPQLASGSFKESKLATFKRILEKDLDS